MSKPLATAYVFFKIFNHSPFHDSIIILTVQL